MRLTGEDSIVEVKILSACWQPYNEPKVIATREHLPLADGAPAATAPAMRVGKLPS